MENPAGDSRATVGRTRAHPGIEHYLEQRARRSQNRQAAVQQAKADHDFVEQELELKTNTELTRDIHALAAEMNRRLDRTRLAPGPSDRADGLSDPQSL